MHDFESDPSLSLSDHEEDSQAPAKWAGTTPDFPRPISYGRAFKMLLINALPLILTYFALFSTKNIAIHYLRDSQDIRIISSVSIAFTLMNILCISIFVGLNIGLVSKASVAFTTKNFKLTGLYLHNALIINTIFMIPCALLMYYADLLCRALGFNADVIFHLDYLLTLCIPGVFFFMLYTTLTSYLNACEIFVAPALIRVISSAIFWILSYYLIRVDKLELLGVGISFNIMEILAACLLLLYIKLKDPAPGTFFWMTKASFKGLWTFFKYQFLAGCMVFLEWIASEVIFLFAGPLKSEQLTGFAIALNNLAIIYVIPTAIGDTLLGFVGGAMGEKDINKAKKFIKVGVISSLGFLLIIGPLYYIFVDEIAAFYIVEPKTLEVTKNIMLIYLILFPGDFIQVTLLGGLRGIGKEKTGTIFLLVCYYVIALPLSYYLCYSSKLEVYGLIIGPIVAVYLILIGLIFIYRKIDWEQQILVVEQNVGVDKTKVLISGDEFERREALLSSVV